MTSRPERRRPALRRLPAVLVLLIIVGSLMRPLFQPPPAGPPAATPEPGTVVPAPPDQVDLAFADPVRAGQAHVTVTDATGRDVGAGPPSDAGRTSLRVTLPPLADGWYQVSYHVPLADGSVRTGGYPFGVGEPAGPAPAGAAAHAGHGGRMDPLTAALLSANVVMFLVCVAQLVRLMRHRRRAR